MKVNSSQVHREKMPMGIDCYRKLQSFDPTGSEKIFEPEVKKYIFGKLIKTVMRVLFSFFVIVSLDGGKGH